jgi:hypothetical protein
MAWGTRFRLGARVSLILASAFALVAQGLRSGRRRSPIRAELEYEAHASRHR